MKTRYLFKQKNEFVELYKTGNYTQKEIAAKVGVSAVTASRWKKDVETAQKTPELVTKVFELEKHVTELESRITPLLLIWEKIKAATNTPKFKRKQGKF